MQERLVHCCCWMSLFRVRSGTSSLLPEEVVWPRPSLPSLAYSAVLCPGVCKAQGALCEQGCMTCCTWQCVFRVPRCHSRCHLRTACAAACWPVPWYRTFGCPLLWVLVAGLCSSARGGHRPTCSLLCCVFMPLLGCPSSSRPSVFLARHCTGSSSPDLFWSEGPVDPLSSCEGEEPLHSGNSSGPSHWVCAGKALSPLAGVRLLRAGLWDREWALLTDGCRPALRQGTKGSSRAMHSAPASGIREATWGAGQS